VYAVLFARAAGWPDARLADHGAAALLHGIGRGLDDTAPARAAFTWLVGRGCADFWLRAALVARHGAGEPLPDGLSVGVSTVRLAVAAQQMLARGERPHRDGLAALVGASGTVPELLDLAAAVLSGDA
jgi:hypothetical protein